MSTNFDSTFSGIVTTNELIQSVESIEGASVLIIGDIMLDEYLLGDAERISPEAPVPVVLLDSERLQMGGAGNVARNIKALKGNATLVGVRGNDYYGNVLEQLLLREGITSSLLPLPDRPTTQKTRIIARQMQVLRYDRENTGDLALAETDSLLKSIATHLPNCDAVIISDYCKGVVSAVLMQGLKDIIAEHNRVIPILVDPKPKNISLYSGVDLLTPNSKETSESTNMPVKTSQEIVKAGQELMSMLGSKHLLTTLGSHGMAVFESLDNVWHIPTFAHRVFDVTGAGDTVIATAALGLAAKLSLLDSCLLANYAAGVVVGEVGAATVSSEQLIKALYDKPQAQLERWL